ncbi:hypothetical protein Moror_14378 [Moniliophthora roreri MCA 2997]|uniref:Uncharacterized protein n=1 Tax=Moniliophthora roreri (strain MCA 2997) TaxID=1381753 RepID=V2W6U3_MONRO|nr:hypothetical protein Moror_14378 [Moniliophthora roreri MCA 2997]
MVSSTPIFNPSESLLPLTKPPQNPSLTNWRPTLVPSQTLIRDLTTRSVWDNEDLKEASSSEPSSSLTNSDDMTDEVYEFLSALFAGRLRLVTSLKIVVSNDGLNKLLETTLPSAHHLLTMISTGVTPTPSSMEMESNSSTNAVENAEEQYEWVYSG